MRKWIVAMLVVGFVGVAAHAEENHTAAPAVDGKKDEKTVVEDKSAKLFSYINACMVNTPPAAIDANVAVK